MLGGQPGGTQVGIALVLPDEVGQPEEERAVDRLRTVHAGRQGAHPTKRHRAAGFTAEQWHYAFTNTLSEEDSRAAHERYAIAAPGTVTEFREFLGRSRWTCAGPGWEQIADAALQWALTH